MKSPWLAMIVLFGFVMLGMFAAQSDIANPVSANAVANSSAVDDRIRSMNAEQELAERKARFEQEYADKSHFSEAAGGTMVVAIALLAIAFAAGFLAISAALCYRILRSPARPPQRRRQIKRRREAGDYRADEYDADEYGADEYGADGYEAGEGNADAQPQEQQPSRNGREASRQVLGANEHLP